MVFLVCHPAPVIHDAVEHQERLAAIRPHPRGGFDMLEIGGTQIKVPTLVAMVRLKADGWRLAGQRLQIVAPVFQLPIDRTPLEQTLGCTDEPGWGLDTVIFQQPNRLRSGEMASLPIRGAELHGGNSQ